MFARVFIFFSRGKYRSERGTTHVDFSDIALHFHCNFIAISLQLYLQCIYNVFTVSVTDIVLKNLNKFRTLVSSTDQKVTQTAHNYHTNSTLTITQTAQIPINISFYAYSYLFFTLFFTSSLPL
jgi:hypothetical protein